MGSERVCVGVTCSNALLLMWSVQRAVCLPAFMGMVYRLSAKDCRM
jgi:hypothetical protein